MNNKHKDIWRALDEVSSYVRQSELPDLLLAEAVRHIGLELAEPGIALSSLEALRKTDGYLSLQEATSRFLAIPKPERLAAVDEMMGIYQGAEAGSWIGYLPSKRIIELVGEPKTARCAFSSSLHSALMLALKGVAVRFEDRQSEVCNRAEMIAAILDVPLQVVSVDPFSRVGNETYDADIIMAPFGHKVLPSDELNPKTLSIIGHDSRSRRLSSEAVALADAQVSTADTVVASVASGAMFRGVGVEPIAREALVEAERLRAILSAPAGMIFPTIGSDILVLGSNHEASDTVRFVNLASSRFAGKTIRGRPQIKPESSWLQAIFEPISSDDDAIVDATIEDIRGKDYILSLDRYLIPPAVAALGRFLSKRETLPLSEAVDLIRPVSLGKGEEGEFVVREAAPADIGESDFLPLPKKELLIDRPQLRKARPQRLFPGDVLLSVKGTIGSVALVPEDAPIEDDNLFWTAGQSFMILRPKKGKVTGVALLEYLSSEAVKMALRSLAVGVTIPTISIKDLKGFQVPVPSDEKNELIKEAFQGRQNKRAQLQALLDDIDREKNASWPHSELQGWKS